MPLEGARSGPFPAVIGLVVGLTFVLLSECLVPDAQAQVLDNKIWSLLSSNCNGLLQGSGIGVLGSNLQAACTTATGTTAASGLSGGGGVEASVQASAVSILNRNVITRIAKFREEDEKENGQTPLISVNQFQMLAPGLLRGLGMTSPSGPTGDSSGASFNVGNQSRWRGLGFFASGVVEALNRDVTTFQDGYKSTILGLTAGVDYRFTRQTVAGLAMSYSNTHGDFINGGDFNTNSLGFTLFGSYLPTDRTFVQVTGGYTNNNYNVSRVATVFIPAITGLDRNLNGLPSGTTRGDVFRLTALMGYDHPIDRFTIGPRVGLNYSNTHILDYTETDGGGLGLTFDDQWVNSLQSVLGVQGQAAFSTSFGVLVPQANVDYIHEFANSQRLITASFVEDLRSSPLKFTFQNDVPVRNYFNLGTGLIMVLPNGLQPFVNFRAMVGNAQFNDYAGTFGLRMEM